MDVAVVGSGIAGLGAAWLMSARARVHLFEAAERPGGHAHTVTVDGPAGAQPVDTGFIVFNRVTYPNLVALFERLDVPVTASNMSFAASLAGGRREYNGGSLAGLFCQPSSLVRPRHYRMIAEILRFYREAPADAGDAEIAELPLGDYLDWRGYSATFRDEHLLPMGAAIWSASLDGIRAFPLGSFVAFCRNHGLLQVRERPQWYTVAGGSRTYVEHVLSDLPAGTLRPGRPVSGVVRTGRGVRLSFGDGTSESFDQVVLAGHADQSRALLGDNATAREAAALESVRYNRSEAVLHSDARLMPKRKGAWASWNFLDRGNGDVAVTYWMNKLQGIRRDHPLFVTLNPPREPTAGSTHFRHSYDHPQFDAAALAAQARLPALQGAGGVWYCGAWCGYGFHEDGLASGLAVAEALTGARRPWSIAERSPAAATCTPASESPAPAGGASAA